MNGSGRRGTDPTTAMSRGASGRAPMAATAIAATLPGAIMTEAAGATMSGEGRSSYRPRTEHGSPSCPRCGWSGNEDREQYDRAIDDSSERGRERPAYRGADYPPPRNRGSNNVPPSQGPRGPDWDGGDHYDDRYEYDTRRDDYGDRGPYNARHRGERMK